MFKNNNFYYSYIIKNELLIEYLEGVNYLKEQFQVLFQRMHTNRPKWETTVYFNISIP